MGCLDGYLLVLFLLFFLGWRWSRVPCTERYSIRRYSISTRTTYLSIKGFGIRARKKHVLGIVHCVCVVHTRQFSPVIVVVVFAYFLYVCFSEIQQITTKDVFECLISYIHVVVDRYVPDSTATGVIVEHSFAMFPYDKTGTSRYFINDTFQFDCAADFIEFLRRSDAPVIIDHNVWHCK